MECVVDGSLVGEATGLVNHPDGMNGHWAP
jgi:hypothetical protein